MNDELKDILSGMQKELSQLNKHAGHISHSLGKMSFNIGKTTPEPVGGELLRNSMTNCVNNGHRKSRNFRTNWKGLIRQMKSTILQLPTCWNWLREVTSYLWVLNLNKNGKL